MDGCYLSLRKYLKILTLLPSESPNFRSAYKSLSLSLSLRVKKAPIENQYMLVGWCTAETFYSLISSLLRHVDVCIWTKMSSSRRRIASLFFIPLLYKLTHFIHTLNKLGTNHLPSEVLCILLYFWVIIQKIFRHPMEINQKFVHQIHVWYMNF